MIEEGQVVLFRFPQTDQAEGNKKIPDLDDVITPRDSDFKQSGLKLPKTKALPVDTRHITYRAVNLFCQIVLLNAIMSSFDTSYSKKH